MRLVKMNTTELQSLRMILRLRYLLVRQRRQTTNTLDGRLYKFRLIPGKRHNNIDKLRASSEPGHNETKDLSHNVQHMAQLCFDEIDDLIVFLNGHTTLSIPVKEEMVNYVQDKGNPVHQLFCLTEAR